MTLNSTAWPLDVKYILENNTLMENLDRENGMQYIFGQE